jgi:hypothetical protein
MPVDMVILGDYVKSVAGRVAHRYRGFVEPEDLRQELALWALEHPRAAAEYLAEAEDGDTRRLMRSLYNAAESYARGCKASSEGYAASDEYFYSLGQLRELLPEAMEGARSWAEATMAPEVPRRSSIAAEGNGRLAMLADVSGALETVRHMSEDRYGLLATKFAAGWTDDMLAQWLGCSEDAARMRVVRALQMVQKILGGQKPQVDPPEVRYVGTRHTLSNAAAQAATRAALAED